MAAHAVLVTALDRPGILSGLTRVLADHAANITYVDIHAGETTSDIYLEFRLPEERLAAVLADLRAAEGVQDVGETPSFAKIYGKRIIVIGGGFSGLACAHELKSRGYDVIVVEARNRFGGRVLSFSDFVKGRNVEGGGELIGSNHPTWVAYAEKFGLRFLDVTEDENLAAPIYLDGRLLPENEAEALYESMTQATALMNADAVEIDADEPWKSPGAPDLDRKTMADWIAGLPVTSLCKSALAVMLSADNAVEVARQSYLGHLALVKGGQLDKFWTESEVYRCAGGNQQLAQRLARDIGEERIRLGVPVTDVTVAADKVVVKCGDGRMLEGDDCVLAVPPTVWNKIRFEPAIPAKIRPQMGTAVKYLASLKARFWKKDGLSPDMLSEGPVSMSWEATDNQPGGDENVAMVGFSGGRAAEQCLAIAKDKVDAEYSAGIGKIYRGFSENFVEARWMDWPREPWAMTGYSFPAPGEVTTVGPHLHQGLGSLHFAGEHVCYKFAGYMEGALNSGASLARRIAIRDGVEKG